MPTVKHWPAPGQSAITAGDEQDLRLRGLYDSSQMAIPSDNANPRASRPAIRWDVGLLLLLAGLSVVTAGAVLPVTRFARTLGFQPLPGLFYLALTLMVVSYLALIEIGKAPVLPHHAACPGRPEPHPVLPAAPPRSPLQHREPRPSARARPAPVKEVKATAVQVARSHTCRQSCCALRTSGAALMTVRQGSRE